MSIESLQRPKTLAEQVYERILDAICNGAIAPGTHVTQDELAERLQVSRMPVMSALAKLKQQGFLEERGRKGLQVAEIDRSRFDAIFELRSALEPLAASLAAQRASKAQIEEGMAIVERGRKAAVGGDAQAALLADVDFHEWLYRASGNVLVEQSMQTHWQHLRRSMGEVLRHPALAARVWDEHLAIAKAIASGNGDIAAKAIAAHVETAHDSAVRKLDLVTSKAK